MYDETQKIARDYGATYTPEFFVLEHGTARSPTWARWTTSPRRSSSRSAYLESAVEAVLKGKKPAKGETNPFGCLIRFKRSRDNRVAFDNCKIQRRDACSTDACNELFGAA